APRRIPGRRGARGSSPGHPRLLRARMTAGLLLLALALLVAATAATIGVAAASVSQAELGRWVSLRLRGSGSTSALVENPGRVLATANALTTLVCSWRERRCPRS